MAAFPFDASASSFSLQNGLGCAFASELAYAGANVIKARVGNEWEMRHFKPYSNTGAFYDAQAFLMARDDMILVAFRGTEPDKIKDWLTDADGTLVPSRLGHVHTGFWMSFSAVWNDILRDIREIQAQGQRSLWFTGHSLGAALATLAVASCHAEGLAVSGHYNFGSPRVGDSSFATIYDQQSMPITFRFVNNNDIVPRVPPRLLSYRHIGIRKYFDSKGRLLADARMVDLLLDSFEGEILGLRKLFGQVTELGKAGLPLPDFIEDHRMENYIACINKNL